MTTSTPNQNFALGACCTPPATNPGDLREVKFVANTSTIIYLTREGIFVIMSDDSPVQLGFTKVLT